MSLSPSSPILTVQSGHAYVLDSNNIIQKPQITSIRIASFAMTHTRIDWAIIIMITDDEIIHFTIGKEQ
jgi:hypothetical protein